MRFRPPLQKPSSKLMLLLHGWTGNEEVMWIFAGNMPGDRWILAPRGTINAPEGGYGWVAVKAGEMPSLLEFKQAASALIAKIDRWAQNERVDSSHFSIMGFSQGAIMSYALSFLYPHRVDSVAALAGYFPSTWMNELTPDSITGKTYYVAHGTQDQTVPIALARESVEELQKAGANVNYCESETGHKLSLACLHGLNDFLSA